MSVVWGIVAEVIRVLSRPIGLASVKPEAFTSVFVDATGTGNYLFFCAWTKYLKVGLKISLIIRLLKL